MEQEYSRIQSMIQKAREEGNKRREKIWRKKLEKWQAAYGAYAPIGIYLKSHMYD